eukprot:scaffold48978_cov33-Tisochrysis_lutea.AAC.2
MFRARERRAVGQQERGEKKKGGEGGRRQKGETGEKKGEEKGETGETGEEGGRMVRGAEVGQGGERRKKNGAGTLFSVSACGCLGGEGPRARRAAVAVDKGHCEEVLQPHVRAP